MGEQFVGAFRALPGKFQSQCNIRELLHRLAQRRTGGIIVQRGDTGMMSVACECDSPSLQRRRSCCASGPMIDPLNRSVAKTRLKTFGIFPQIMKKASQFGFAFESEWSGESFRQFRHVAEMHRQWLPSTRALRQRFALFVFGRVRVELHLQFLLPFAGSAVGRTPFPEKPA